MSGLLETAGDGAAAPFEGCIPLNMSTSADAMELLFGGGTRLTPPGPESVIGPRSGRGASPSSIVPASSGSNNEEAGAGAAAGFTDGTLKSMLALGGGVKIGDGCAAGLGCVTCGLDVFTDGAVAAGFTLISANMSSEPAATLEGVVDVCRGSGASEGLEAAEDIGMPVKAAESEASAGLMEGLARLFVAAAREAAGDTAEAGGGT
jgi:hypothetical protein